MNVGELRHLVKIRRWQDVPSTPGAGITQTFDAGADAWAKLEPVTGGVYYGTTQTDHAVTHRFTIRFMEGVTAEHVVDCETQRYRVRRSSHSKGDRLWTFLDVEELGPAT